LPISSPARSVNRRSSSSRVCSMATRRGSLTASALNTGAPAQAGSRRAANSARRRTGAEHSQQLVPEPAETVNRRPYERELNAPIGAISALPVAGHPSPSIFVPLRRLGVRALARPLPRIAAGLAERSLDPAGSGRGRRTCSPTNFLQPSMSSPAICVARSHLEEVEEVEDSKGEQPGDLVDEAGAARV
jgi:hypothetical protein